MYLGDYAIDSTFYFYFTTRRFSTGAPHTLAGTPSLSAYEDASDTQITAGLTLGVDADSRTGLNRVTVVATGANGYETGKSYAIIIEAGTVDSVSVVGEVVGFFTIERAAAIHHATVGLTVIEGQTDDIGAAGAGLTAVTVAAIAANAITASAIADNAIDAGAIAADAITAAKIADGAIDANTFAAGAITASAIAADAIGASELAADAVTEIANAVWDTDATGRQTAGTFGQAIGDPGADTTTIYQSVVTDAAGTNVAADIVAVKAETAAIVADTNELQTDWADGGRLDLILDARASQTSVNTIDDFLDTEIAAILAAVDTEVAAILALLDDARTEPGQGNPPVNPDMATKVDYLYKSWRNKKDNQGTETKLYADDGSTVDQKQTTAESGGTVTIGEWITGA
jgi:hypothetical protein